MTHKLQIHRESDKIQYKIEGEWDPLEISQIISKIDLLESEYIMKYRNFIYEPPVKGKSLFIFSYTQKPGYITFESDVYDYTLEEFIEKNHTKLSFETIKDLIGQIWNACNSMRETPCGIQVLSLHPRNIAITEIPESNGEKFVVHLLNYVPFIFRTVFDESEKLFIFPNATEQVESVLANERYEERTEVYSLGCLIAYLVTGELPYHYGTTAEMLQIDYENNCINLPTKKMVIEKLTENESYIQSQKNGNCHDDEQKEPSESNENNENYEYKIEFEESEIDIIDECLKLLNGIFYKKYLWKDTIQHPFIKHCLECTTDKEQPTPQDFEVLQELGSGNFGTAYLTTQTTRRGRRTVALKEIIFSEEESELVERELTIMKLCYHPNIVKLYDILFLDTSFCNPENTDIIDIVMEYCDGGDLNGFIENKFPNGITDDSVMKHLLVSLAKGLSYLHQDLNVYHRDLKLDNILIKNNPGNANRPILKISDFGLSKIVDEGNTQTVVGTPLFMAPQVICQQMYSHKCDLYSLGILLFYLKSHSYPFGIPHDLGSLLNRMNIPNYVEYNDKVWGNYYHLKELVKGLIVVDEMQRFDWDDIFKNPYMKSALNQFKKEN